MPDQNDSQSRTFAFTHAGLIAMGSDGLHENQTVLIQGERIVATGAANKIELPPDTTVIDAGGSYLIPGLANMHAHLYDFDSDPRHLALYLAHGVTTVRSLNSRKETFT